MSEDLKCAFNALVYVYDPEVSQWSKRGVARVSIFEDVLAMKFRVVARSALNPAKILINTFVFTGMSLREDQNIFVQWADQRCLYGIKFDKPAHAKEFAGTLNDYIDQMSSSGTTEPTTQLAKVELDPKFEPVRMVLEIMLSDYNRFFGHFGQTYDKLGCVPTRLRAAIEFLESNLHTPYLLGSKLDYGQLKRAEELSTASNEPDMSSEDLAVVGEYLKVFYKDHAPLMVMDNFEPATSFVGLGDNYEGQAEFILSLINSLPEKNRQLLQVLIWLLANVAWNTEQNFMTSDIVSRIFAPFILQPASLEYAQPEKVKLKSKLVF
eukprot:TRINITY_DN11413_c0_g1_i1.p1 TRINITY_DN11413_c0_g1~~TRINITY_DN11413_c0_g1_i1.p1  ORF type:complete len:354 (+),score=84.71 TRINITY_DN11413_c0_g1_i1:96-1064(+)